MEFLCVEKEDDVLDGWPKLDDGSDWDGNNLCTLVRQGRSPFKDFWSVATLIGEIERKLNSVFFDIAKVSAGANHYGIHIQFLDRPDVMARLSRGDCNSTRFRHSVREKMLRWHVPFEAATYKVLEPLAEGIGSLLYYREGIPAMRNTLSTLSLSDFSDAGTRGRSLLLFPMAPGQRYDYGHWRALSKQDKSLLLLRFARIAAQIFRFRLPRGYTCQWLMNRIFGPDHGLDQINVEPTRRFCAQLLTARIHWIFDHLDGAHSKLIDMSKPTRGCLLSLVPLILPPSSTNTGNEDALYRFVLDHGDFGMHNATINYDSKGPQVTSVFDWEAASIVPVLLSEPKMIVTVDMIIDQNGNPAVSRWGDGDSIEQMDNYRAWATEYYKWLFLYEPDYRGATVAGKDARYLWFTLRDYAQTDAEEWLGSLTNWAFAKAKDVMERDLCITADR